MSTWLRRIRGAFVMGLTWAVGWGVVGLVFEALLNVISWPEAHVIDMWPQALGMVGFLSGAVFSAVLGIAGRRHRFEELSFPRFTIWGAVGGLLLGGFAAAAGGLSSTLAVALVIGVPTLLSAGSAAGTLAIGRLGKERALPDAGGDPTDARRTGGGGRGGRA